MSMKYKPLTPHFKAVKLGLTYMYVNYFSDVCSSPGPYIYYLRFDRKKNQNSVLKFVYFAAFHVFHCVYFIGMFCYIQM